MRNELSKFGRVKRLYDSDKSLKIEIEYFYRSPAVISELFGFIAETCPGAKISRVNIKVDFIEVSLIK